ncbi:MAG: hypothetical protein MUC96_19710 [Myxococcaceae bacterium]|jgi:hypothetical protein|nr:hypothetical protein [Myxococcaceae bacterium]
MERVVSQAAQAPSPVELVPLADLDAVWTAGGDVRSAVTRVVAATVDRAAFVEAALQRLADAQFGRETLEGRSRRSVYVEAVLAAGYPWALQLEPADVTHARELEQAQGRARRAPFWRAAVAGITLGLMAGLAFAAWAAGWPADGGPPPATGVDRTGQAANPEGLDPKRPRTERVVAPPAQNPNP